MKTKNLILGLLFMAVFSVMISCKEENIFTNDNDLVTTKSGYPELMKEPLVQEMLAELASYNISVNRHGLLEFESKEDINKVIDILEEYDNKFVDKELKYPTDPILVAFETAYTFSSLRKEIEDITCLLERKESLTDENDPDNHHIVCDYFRTVLTPQNEVEINDLICVYLDEDIGVGIMNEDYNSLDELQKIINGNPTHFQETVGQYCLCDGNSFLLPNDDPDPYCDADFYYYVSDDDNPKEITFINTTSSTGYNNITYDWYLDDGTSTSEKDPVHTYDFEGNYDVTLKVYQSGYPCDEKTKTISVYSSNICNADFSSNIGADGLVNFHSYSSSSGTITSYLWDFDDDETSSEENPSHTYSQNGSYTVKLTIHDSNGDSDEYSDIVYVENAKECCKSNAKETRYYEYIDDERKIKLVCKARNVWPLHWIVAQTKNYKITWYGKIRNKADKIEADYGGNLYDSNCDTSIYVNYPYDDNVRYNKWKATARLGYNAFRVKNKSVESSYYISDEGTTKEDVGVYIHQADCN
ncbi:MAG: PKD domain-containing protein [Candidatus Delongbacteria bacterium]|jgi:PKD repeat protein|nr:PKD domain-containing protein [Candidatus Delongbacteria bacterium]